MYRVGVDIGGTKIQTGLFDRTGTVYHQQKVSSNVTLSQASTSGKALAQHLKDFLAQCGVAANEVEAIAIGFPGIKDLRTGVIINCPNLNLLNGCALAVEVESILKIPTLLEKDVNLIGLSEYVHRRESGIDDFACIFVGSGVGCAMILNGELYQGADGLSGEFGHIPVEPHGVQCTCGGIGCLEMYCSGKALTLCAPDILGKPVDAQITADNPWIVAEEVIKAAQNGNALAISALQNSFHYLGLGIVTLINILNLRLIVLGGGIVDGWPQGMDTVKTVVRERGRVGIRDRIQIARPTLGELPHLVGANVLIENYLQSR